MAALAGLFAALYLLWLVFAPPPSSWLVIWIVGLASAALASFAVATLRFPGVAYRDFLARTGDVHVLVVFLLFGLALQQVVNRRDHRATDVSISRIFAAWCSTAISTSAASWPR